MLLGRVDAWHESFTTGAQIMFGCASPKRAIQERKQVRSNQIRKARRWTLDQCSTSEPNVEMMEPIVPKVHCRLLREILK